MPGTSSRRRPRLRAAALTGAFIAAVIPVAGCGGERDRPAASTPAGGTPSLEPIATGLARPVQTIAIPGDDDRLWALEQAGRVREIVDGSVKRTPLLDVTATTASEGEQGLLALALHPDFPATDRVYVHRSDRAGDTLVTEHRVDAGRISAVPLRTLLRVDQPYENHNGGTLAFGPDGLLYLGLGDGGSASDPHDNAQDPDARLGKLLRVDIATPDDWRVAALGLRNPWRFSFDPATGDAWIGDVGQNAWEEVDVFPNGSELRNYEWSMREGRHRHEDGAAELSPEGVPTGPVAEYGHDEGCSITGGVVVHDPSLAGLDGRYLFADYCSGTFWSIPADPDGEHTPRREPFRTPSPVSIDATGDGRVLITSHEGTIFRLRAGEPNPPASDGTPATPDRR